MARKMDKLAQDMIQCNKDGYGCHYGKWKAMQEPVMAEKKIPEGWKVCPWCKKAFKPVNGQRYCELYCRTQAYAEKTRASQTAYTRKWRAKRGAEDAE